MQHTVLINESNETVTNFGINMGDVERFSVAGEAIKDYQGGYSPENA